MKCLHCGEEITELIKYKGEYYQCCDKLCCHDIGIYKRLDKKLGKEKWLWEWDTMYDPQFADKIPVEFD